MERVTSGFAPIASCVANGTEEIAQIPLFPVLVKVEEPIVDSTSFMGFRLGSGSELVVG